MVRTVRLSHVYTVSPERLWALVTDFSALEAVMEGLVAFGALPEGRVQAGQDIHVTVSLFGKLPPQPYRMQVLECDDDAMYFRSLESGAGVKRWEHVLSVSPTEWGSRLQEAITIDAGLLTPAFALWARYLYSNRHQGRLKLLGLPQERP